MEGVVKYINPTRGMVAVLIEDGQYSVFELLGGDPVEQGDVVSWLDDTALGSELITNHTQKQRYEVYFQNHYVHPSHLRQQLLYP
jgi:hypothetical protein